jgi:quinol-cytochrome oxidoreductase complex cytochrome b subunit
MGVDYRNQYRPDQLEPFWPNELFKMATVVLCTLAVIMFFAILPVLLNSLGFHPPAHAQEPANPRGATPAGIKPEWYFLPTYQYLRLMPARFLGISGKTLGVLSQGALVTALILLPFWYRRRAHVGPGILYRTVVTLAVVSFVVLMIWGGWPEAPGRGEEQQVPLSEYFAAHVQLFVFTGAALLVFFLLIAHERRAIRRVLDAPSPDVPDTSQRSGSHENLDRDDHAVGAAAGGLRR